MKITSLFNIILTLVLLCTLGSCQSREERAISRLNSLARSIDKNGENYTVDDWAEAMEDLADIHEDMADCEFSKEQLKELGQVDGRLSIIIAREGAKALGKETVTFIDRFNSFAVGFREGAESEYDEDDFNQIEEDFNNELDSIANDWE